MVDVQGVTNASCGKLLSESTGSRLNIDQLSDVDFLSFYALGIASVGATAVITNVADVSTGAFYALMAISKGIDVTLRNLTRISFNAFGNVMTDDVFARLCASLYFAADSTEQDRQKVC